MISISQRLCRVTPSCAGLLLFLAACGSDSTAPAPTGLDATAALQSLTIGLGTAGGMTSLYSPSGNGLAALAPQLDQIDVTINGKAQRMFAVGLRETYPVGTCVETLISSPTIVVPPGQCTAPPFAFALILWQSHSANAAPDRMALIVGNIGAIDFAPNPTVTGATPALALYLEGKDNLWDSKSGTLTSNVAATTQTCGVPLPPFAKSGSCNFANFDEQGTIVFEPFWGTTELTLVIPRQTIHGIWQTITETQTITVPTP
jgi:hypothetical protein